MAKRGFSVLAMVMIAGLAGCGGHGGASTARSRATTTTAHPATTTVADPGTTTELAPPTTTEAGPTPAGTGTTSPAPPHPATTGTPRPAPGPSCRLGPQGPPAGTIPADNATALAFAPDGRLFYTERSGAVRVVQSGQAQVFASVPTVTTEAGGGYSERGLLGLAIDPQFGQDHFVYAFYSDADRAHQNVIRWTDCAGTGTTPTIVIRLPSGPDCCHKGGRLAFGPDGKLYVTLGEEHTASAAQDTGDVRGKVLRYNPDGTIPGDNPFGPGSPVWAYGFRNPFGLAWSATGQLAVTSNGPSGEIAGGPATGYDTVVAAVARGAGYQWPLCYGYRHPLAGDASCGGQRGPDWSSENTTVVPTGATFVDGSGPAGYAGHLVFCTFAAGMKILGAGAVSDGPAACRLDVKQGPDHALYYSDPGHIYRMA